MDGICVFKKLKKVLKPIYEGDIVKNERKFTKKKGGDK